MKFKNFAELSMKVGWDGNDLPIPPEAEADKAIADVDEVQLLTWQRFCLSARTEQERKVQTKIFEAFLRLTHNYKGTENKNTWDSEKVKEEVNGNKNA